MFVDSINKQVQRSLTVLVLLLAASAAVLAQAPDDRPFLVETAGNADPNLFSLYVLGRLYDSMPGAKATAQQQADWISTTRAEAWRMRAIVRDQQLDPALDPLFQDCLNFTSAYETFLQERGQIQAAREQRAAGDFLSSMLQALGDASDADDFARRVGASDDDASSIGEVAGVVSGLRDYGARSQRSDAAAAAALQAAGNKLTGSWQQAEADLRTTSAHLARVHGWSPGETGFAGDAASSPQAMPRNPFVLAAAASRLDGKENARELIQRANRCFQAAELVPAGSAYDEYRQTFLFEAATLTVVAVSTEDGNGGYSAAPLPSATYAVQMARTYLAMAPSDPGGSGNLLLARALGGAGRYGEAVAAETTAFQIAPETRNDASSTYRYARLLSLSGYVDSSAQWLQTSYANGFSAVNFVRQDPDLANLRRQKPQVFARLTTPVLTNPQFVWGLMLDDAWVRNESPFDLTHVVVDVTVHKGGAVYRFKMSCDRIKAGETCRNDNVVSIPGDAYDYVQATYTSDQGL